MPNDLLKSGVRKERKQIAEKRRRQRMNDILVQIRDLVYDDKLIQMADKENQRIEKAEILERAVHIIKDVRKKQNQTRSRSESVYQKGFVNCLSEINSFFLTVDCSHPFRQKIIEYLTRNPGNPRINDKRVGHTQLSESPNQLKIQKETCQNNSPPSIMHDTTVNSTCYNQERSSGTSNSNFGQKVFKDETASVWRPWM